MKSVLYRSLFFVIFATFLMATIAGCGDPKVGRVHGTVTLDGEPLPKAYVIFHPEKGRQSTAMTDKEGRYVLELTTDKAGALVGDHMVEISTVKETGNTDGSYTPELVPEKYREGIPTTVERGKNEVNFELKSTD